MNQLKASAGAWRLIVVMLCVSAVRLGFAQIPPNRTQTKPPVNETRGVNRPQIFVPRPTTSVLPLLFGMNRNDVSRTLEGLHLRPAFSGLDGGIAVDQKPVAGTTLQYGSVVSVTFDQLPRLVLGAAPTPASTTSDLRLTAAFEPPLPAGTPVSYQYTWGDGTFAGPTGEAVFTHRFAEASNRLVSVVATVNDRARIQSRISVDVVAPPPSDTAQTSTRSDTSTTTQTATSDTSTATATTTRVDTGTTTTSTTETVSATSDTTPTTPVDTTPTATSTTDTTGTVPTNDQSSNPLVWIGAAAVVLLLVVTFLLARVLRALNRKPSEPRVQAKSPVAFNGGVRAIEYEIEHPELIRRGPAVGLRGGVRAEEGDDV
jgi:hypothetical protein